MRPAESSRSVTLRLRDGYCDWCAMPMPPDARADARFCLPKCKQAAFRAAKTQPVAHVQGAAERPATYLLCPKCRVLVPELYGAWDDKGRKRLNCWCGSHVDFWIRLGIVGLPTSPGAA